MTQQPGTAPGPRLNLRGAVDLSSLARPASTEQPGAAAGAGVDGGTAGGVVVDVTDVTFGNAIDQSMTVPVVVDLRSDRSPASQQLSADLKAIAVEYAGRFLLAEVDVDASPEIAQAFQVQSIPSVVAVVKGQPVPLFQGAYPVDQLRQVLDELLRVAAENGVTGTLDVAGGAAADADAAAEPEEPPLPPLHAEAYDAIERDDLDAAADAYRRALTESPADADAKAGLAQVELMRRTQGADPAAARAAAAADPQDLDAQLLAADLDVMGGHVDDAFARLVDTVRVTAGDDRDRVRERLVELFEIVGTDDDRVVRARRSLASALY